LARPPFEVLAVAAPSLAVVFFLASSGNDPCSCIYLLPTVIDMLAFFVDDYAWLFMFASALPPDLPCFPFYIFEFEYYNIKICQIYSRGN
jgi:hypothetical protein